MVTEQDLDRNYCLYNMQWFCWYIFYLAMVKADLLLFSTVYLVVSLEYFHRAEVKVLTQVDNYPGL